MIFWQNSNIELNQIGYRTPLFICLVEAVQPLRPSVQNICMHFQYIFIIKYVLVFWQLVSCRISTFLVVLWRLDNVIFEGLLAPMQHKVSHKSQNFIRHLNACPKIFFGCYRISIFNWASVSCKYGEKIKGARIYGEVLLSSLSSRANKKTIVWQPANRERREILTPLKLKGRVSKT